MEALAGRAHCEWLLGNYELALGTLREGADLDADWGEGMAQLRAELQLLLGRPDRTLEALDVERAEGEVTADAVLVAAVAWLDRGREDRASECARRAFLGNLYLVAALLGEELPDFGLTHGTFEAGPEFALSATDRLAPYFESRPERVDDLVRIASTPTVRGEVESLIRTAQALNGESDPDQRRRLIARLSDLRNPSRLKAGTEAVLGELALDP